MCRKINLLRELKKLARGKDPIMPIRELAKWAAQWAEIGLSKTEIGQLEHLYRLPDPRN
jgi:hypothetical protein